MTSDPLPDPLPGPLPGRTGSPAGRPPDLPPPAAPPLPGPALMRQTWRQVVFLHWPVEPARVAHLFPDGTEPDVLDGLTHVGLVGFRVTACTLGAAVPLGGFGEVNVRLYSRDRHGRRGVVFLTLDVDRPDLVAVGAALGLGYRWSRITVGRRGADLAGRCRRRGRPGADGRPATGGWQVGVTGRLPEPAPLDVFLTARWGLHVRRLGRTWWVPVAHEPWRLYRGEARCVDAGLVAAADVPADTAAPPAVLCAPCAHAAVGRPQPV